MLYRVIKRLIERRQVDGLSEKVDVLYVAGKLTEAEYTELTALLEGAN